ncbi:MAG: hypothetical protein RR827_04950 [Oscillospiraceae bacterium]
MKSLGIYGIITSWVAWKPLRHCEQCLEKLALFPMRTFDRQIAPLRCGGGSAAIIVLCTMNLWYNNLMGGVEATTAL